MIHIAVGVCFGLILFSIVAAMFGRWCANAPMREFERQRRRERNRLTQPARDEALFVWLMLAILVVIVVAIIRAV
jgi:hypothetical protein